MADNAQIARSLYEAFNQRDMEQIAAAVAPDGILTVVGTGEQFVGAEGARQYNRMWLEGFPDGKATVESVYAAGDTVVVEFRGEGTHTGTLRTSMGDIPATGRSATLQLCDVYEFENGKVKTQRAYFDSGALMVQLGLLTQQPAATQQ
jgi:steroid delta-isomerase-like uncharacterized protein